MSEVHIETAPFAKHIRLCEFDGDGGQLLASIAFEHAPEQLRALFPEAELPTDERGARAFILGPCLGRMHLRDADRPQRSYKLAEIETWTHRFKTWQDGRAVVQEALKALPDPAIEAAANREREETERMHALFRAQEAKWEAERRKNPEYRIGYIEKNIETLSNRIGALESTVQALVQRMPPEGSQP